MLSLFDQISLVFFFPAQSLFVVALQLCDLTLQLHVLTFQCCNLHLWAVGLCSCCVCRRFWLLADPSFGSLFDLHSNDVLHSLFNIVFVQVLRDLPVLYFLKLFIFFFELLSLHLDDRLEIVCFFTRLFCSTCLWCWELRNTDASRWLLYSQCAIVEIVCIERITLIRIST